jgi:two-component system, NtrC family, response regulator AtoC
VNILLVEDVKGVRQSLSEFLRQAGHGVMECSHGEDALAVLEKQTVDLVLSDIQMPVMDGHELLRKIKSSDRLKDVEVVLFTGYGHVKSAVEAMRNGAADYLIKPVDIRELDLILKRVSEWLSLKRENRDLTDRLQQAVQLATQAVVASEAMRHVFETAEKLHARPEMPVLIEGETGTGKELVARFIHYGPERTVLPFVGLNCAAISPALFESELFGYEAGSFTGGNPKGQKGKLELAANGTLFLDEITEMPAEHQAKLLRVMQERDYYRVGGVQKMSTRTRFICATNQNIALLVREGRFRQDLFFRLNVGLVSVPPLRERTEEILPLARFFMERLGLEKKVSFRSLHPQAVRLMEGYSWPGNVRELKNTIERIALYWDDEEIKPEHVQACFQKTALPAVDPPSELSRSSGSGIPFDRPMDLKKWNLELVQKALAQHQGNLTHTAKFLGLSIRELHTYIRRLKTKK